MTLSCLTALVFLGAGAVTDWRTRRIPLLFLIIGACLSAALTTVHIVREGAAWGDLALSLLPGAGLIVLSLLARRSMGLGDGLAVLIVGPLLGAARCILTLAAAILLGALVAIVLLVLRRAHRKTRLPFLPILAAAAGAVVYACAGEAGL